MLLLGAGLCAAPREPRCAARQEQPMQLPTAGDRYGAGSSKGPEDPAWGWPGESGEEAPRAGRCGAARGALAALRALFCLWEQSLVPEGRPVTGHGPQPHAATGPSALHLLASCCSAGPTPGGQEKPRAMESWCWGQERGGSAWAPGLQGWSNGSRVLARGRAGAQIPSHGAPAASAPSMGLAALDIAKCCKDGSGAAGVFPDGPFRERPSLGEAGGLHALCTCVSVCVHAWEPGVGTCECVCSPRSPCSGSAPRHLSCRAPWPGQEHHPGGAAPPLSLSLSLLRARPGRCRIPGCSLGTPVTAFP